MTKIDIGEFKHLLKQLKEVKLTLGLSFNATNGTINEFSDDTKLKGVAWSSTKSYWSAGYTPILDGLTDLFYTTITTLENFIHAFESEVTASGGLLDLGHLQDLQNRRDELQREKNELLPRLLEQASKIPGLGYLFDEHSLLQAEKRVQLLEDFKEFLYRHESDFSELNGLIEQLLLGLEELGKQRSFNGPNQGYSPINFMNLSWSKRLEEYHKKHGEDVKKVQKKDLDSFKNMAEVAGGAAAMESFGTNVELANMGSSIYSVAKNSFSEKNKKLPSAPDGEIDSLITDGTHINSGKLKPNTNYKTGEFDYFYETDSLSRIKEFSTNDLNITTRDGRLTHDPKSPGKLSGDHAGHLAGDRFGGSPNLDNIVSQSSNVNLSQYKKIENEWATAIKNGLPVSVKVKINYDGNSLRPTSFDITYTIDGALKKIIINN